jgi:hypothetical protein
MSAGVAGAVMLGASVFAGSVGWAAAAVVPAFAVAAAPFARRPAAHSARGDRTAEGGIVDCAGRRLGIGDTVRAGDGFDGPMELGFGRGVIVKVAQGKAHVRFNDIPGQVHPVTPGTLRRLA